jgi:5-(carboxyamino)imidazole ribonucleotide mutase
LNDSPNISRQNRAKRPKPPTGLVVANPTLFPPLANRRTMPIIRRFPRVCTNGQTCYHQWIQAMTEPLPRVGIIMGSQSDWPTMKHAADILEALGVDHEVKIISAHRTPDRMADYAKSAKSRGLHVIIAGAGGAAHLPGMTASMTPLPVLGVPIQSRALSGQDSLLSIAQMPGGIPVGTLAIGDAGAKNAALLAASILSLNDAPLATRLDAWRKAQTDAVAETPDRNV